MNKKKLTINIILFLMTIIFLSGCQSEARKESNKKEKILDVVTNLTKKPYIDGIQKSKIVSPDALINAFNIDFDLAFSIYDKQTLAIPVTIDKIKSGKLVFNTDNEQTVIDGNYAYFSEFIDEKKQKKENINSEKTSLVCSIDTKDDYLLEYGKSKGIDSETKKEIPPLVSNYYLVGTIYSVVGSEKYNILMKDVRLIPGTTYKALQPKENIEKDNTILDVESGENINEKVKQYFWTDTDFDSNGICDLLTLQTNEYNPESSFDKLIYNDIYKKIITPLKSVIQLVYNDKNYSFNLNFPLKIKDVLLIKTSSFDGSILNVFQINMNGLNKKDINYKENKDKINNTLTELNTNSFYLENQTFLCQANRDGINTFKIKLLDGRETESINSDIVFMKNISIDTLGNITGDIYIKALYPYEFYYKANLRIMSNNVITEVSSDNYTFYDKNYFDEFGEFKTSYDVKKFEIQSKLDIPIANKTERFSEYEITNEKNIMTGYGVTSSGKVNIFKTSNQKFAIIDIKKDEKENYYWLYIANDKVKGYIPVTIDNYFTNKNTKINILTKINNNNYNLNDLFLFNNNKL